MSDNVHSPVFWSSAAVPGVGLSCHRTVASLSTCLDSGPCGPRSPAAEASRGVTVVPADPGRKERADAAGAGSRPATAIDMDECGAIVAVRRAADGFVLGVFMDEPRDGAGMCFQPLRSPAAIRELVDDGIIA